MTSQGGTQGPHSRRPQLREFVGFVWKDDWAAQTGLLVEAANASEARNLVKEIYGSEFHVSLWNEQDAKKSR